MAANSTLSPELARRRVRADAQHNISVSIGGLKPKDKSAEQETVADLHHDYRWMSENWEPITALLGGTRAMRESASAYLPQEHGEADDEHQARVNRSTLFNAYRRTRSNLVGRVFEKPIQLGQDVPPALVEFAEDVDGHGSHLNVFARNLFRNAMDRGLSHILVDMPRVQSGLTLADERRQKRRPYWAHIRAEQVIGWRHEMRQGVKELTQVRILEQTMVNVGQWGQQPIHQVRVLNAAPDGGDFGTWELWRKGEEDKWVQSETGILSLPEIPLVTVYTGRIAPMVAEPPLLDLAHMNIQHFQSGSDQRNILHIARVPILFGKGLADADGDIEVGAMRMVKGPPDSDLKYVEHTGAAIDAGAQDLKALEDQMRVLGMETLMPRTGNATATGRAIDAAENRSILQENSIALQDALENAMQVTADWLGLPSGGSLSAHTDFGISMTDAQDAREIISAMNTNQLSRETGWEELKRRGFLSDEFDGEAEAERLDDQVSAAMSNFGGDLPGANGDDDDDDDEGAGAKPKPDPDDEGSGGEES